MKTNKICYLGDDNIHQAAAYLAGIMTHFGLEYDRVDSASLPPDDFLETEYAAYVLSDYPAKNFRDADWEHLVRCVENGSGLLMFGGWESFHGRLGEYHDSPLAEVLPVEMLAEDDRRNYSQPVFVVPTLENETHPILAGLPWETPPGVGGFNSFWPKKNADVLLNGIRLHLEYQKDEDSEDTIIFQTDFPEIVPLLVLGKYGRGNTAAFASDVAPHWVGGFVDWGKNRITQEIPGAGFIEIGEDYAKFFRNLLVWAKKR